MKEVCAEENLPELGTISNKIWVLVSATAWKDEYTLILTGKENS